ncbi:sterol carrier family protein [uncultured Amnibacterium sp.]|uniref:sterol carrier family protein n=1 Tax=uncultured Amnibacterium sp. TaxID=1631851 RepID=UPI0035CADBB6
MAKARIPAGEGDQAVAAAVAGDADRPVTATAVRYLLQLLADRYPGGAVEVRVPPFGAVQCIEGLDHRRGTPPNVVEMTAPVWLHLATGQRGWSEALESGAVQASGSRADLTGRLPVWRESVQR